MYLTRLRSAYHSGKLDPKTAQGLFVDAQYLLCVGRASWAPPDASLYPAPVSHWIEELLHIAIRLVACYLRSPAEYAEDGLLSRAIALLLFCAAQAEQFDAVRPAVDRVVQDLSCADALVPFFVSARHSLAVTLLLDTYGDALSAPALAAACAFLSRCPTLCARVPRFLPRLECARYASLAALVRVQLRVQHRPRCAAELSECAALVDGALAADSGSFALWHAKAYLCALGADVCGAFACVRRALALRPQDPRVVLLALRVLRANGQPEHAAALAESALRQFQLQSKWIRVELMRALAEAEQEDAFNECANELFREFPDDADVLCSITKAQLARRGGGFVTTKFVKAWAAVDDGSADFFFCFAQFCVLQKDYDEAKRFMHMAINVDPYRAEYYCGMAHACLFEGEVEEAREAAKMGIEIDPCSFMLWKVYEMCLSEEKEEEELEEVRQKLEQLRGFGEIELENIELILFQNDSSLN